MNWMRLGLFEVKCELNKRTVYGSLKWSEVMLNILLTTSTNSKNWITVMRFD